MSINFALTHIFVLETRLGDSVTTISPGSLEMQAALSAAQATIDSLKRRLGEVDNADAGPTVLERRAHINAAELKARC